MLINNKQIAVGLIIDQNLNNGIQILNQLKFIHYIDLIIVIQNRDYNLDIKNDYLKVDFIKNNQFNNIIKTKNKILKYCYQRDIQNIFLITDNIQIKDALVFVKYIGISTTNNLNFMSFNNSKIFNKNGVNVHNKLLDDFIFLTRDTIKFNGYFNEELNENNYIEEYYSRVIEKEAIIPCLYSFPDIQNSNDYLKLIKEKTRQPNWSFLKRKYKTEDLTSILIFNEETINNYYRYKTVTAQLKKKKEYTTAACLIAKNENQYLDEWIQYYYQLGFDNIIIYENNCKIKLKYSYPYVTIIQWNYEHCQQQQNAYIHCLRKTGPHVDFIAFFDADEFLYIKDGVSLQDFLRTYSDCFGIAINWRLFGNNGLEKIQNNNYQVLSRFTKCGKELKEEVKLILNSYLINEMGVLDRVIFHSSHYINYPVSLTDKSYHIGPLNNNIQNSSEYTAQVYHYPLKTMEEFLKFKQSRGRADIVVQDDSYKTNQYWNQLNKNQIQNFNIAYTLDRNKDSHYVQFNLLNGGKEYIKFEHISRFNFENQIKYLFSLDRKEVCDRKPLVTISILPPKDVSNWQKQQIQDRPYINYTKIENNRLYFYIQIVNQKEKEVYKFNCIFTFIWKMFFTSLMFNYNTLVLHGILLQNGNLIVGTTGCGKTTLAQRITIDNTNLVVCDDNILITFKDDKLIAQPLPMLPYVKEGRQFKWTRIDFNKQFEVKNILILNKDKEERIKQIDINDWRRIIFYSCLVLIYQPFAQRNDVYDTNFEKWINCRKGLKQVCQKRMINLIEKIEFKPLMITTNTKDITKNINKQLKDFLCLS